MARTIIRQRQRGFIFTVLLSVCALTTAGEGGPTDEQLFYSRAFELALWAMPATDSFATREAVIRDLKGKPNDVVINTRPMDSDIHLVALQTQTPYLQGALDLY